MRRRQHVQAKAIIFGVELRQSETTLIREGNKAAHWGSGLVDEALIVHDLMPFHGYARIFEAQYGIKPGNFTSLHPLLKNTLSCDSTLLVTPGTKRSINRRNATKEMILIIKKEFAKVATGCDPLVDLDAVVDNLEKTTSRIVDMDRRENHRLSSVSKLGLICREITNIGDRPKSKLKWRMVRNVTVLGRHRMIRILRRELRILMRLWPVRDRHDQRLSQWGFSTAWIRGNRPGRVVGILYLRFGTVRLEGLGATKSPYYVKGLWLLTHLVSESRKYFP